MKNHIFRLHMGLSLFIVIFVTMCLVTFAVLSLVSAKANERMYQQQIYQIESYYELSNQAYQKLSDIDQQLHKIYYQYPQKQDYFQQVEKQFSVSKDHIYELTISGQTQSLHVKIKIIHSQSLYELIEMKKINNQPWNPEQGMNIYGGNK